MTLHTSLRSKAVKKSAACAAADRSKELVSSLASSKHRLRDAPDLLPLLLASAFLIRWAQVTELARNTTLAPVPVEECARLALSEPMARRPLRGKARIGNVQAAMASMSRRSSVATARSTLTGRVPAGCSDVASDDGRLGGSSVSVSAVLQEPLTTSPPSTFEMWEDARCAARVVASKPGGGAIGGTVCGRLRSNKPGGADVGSLSPIMAGANVMTWGELRFASGCVLSTPAV
eukprot:CAMPEP_0115257866 /NCGR_PEP_ID=MMETSP0270-20121206/46995_1 /TAXON_ID=71861 /ORGANISM="Scrippsiella trochoidea, Strain CCMP3099" /LENGTH=232 /DNA_ID=CAMNT_0002673589 /DNA_START=47 /DNA_END=746 /DNA_ORIENTATION=+